MDQGSLIIAFSDFAACAKQLPLDPCQSAGKAWEVQFVRATELKIGDTNGSRKRNEKSDNTSPE